MNFKIPPWKHQLEAVHRSLNTRCFGLFFEMGCGKTGALINILRTKYLKEKRIMRTLILCPPVVISNWVAEFGMHSNIRPSVLLPLTGPGSKRADTFSKMCFDKAGKLVSRIVITNYESLTMEGVWNRLHEWGPEVLVLDESHRCKNYKAKRTKKAIVLGDTARYCYCLSGTPMPNGITDLWAQYRILDGGEAFGRNFFAFRAQYLWDANAGMPKIHYFPKWIVREDAVKRVNSKLDKSAMRVKKVDCLDLPPLVKTRINVDLSPEQGRAYQDMKREFIAEFGGGACVARLAITKALRLQQILSGFIKVEQDGVETIKRFASVPRLEALKELLEDATPGHKVIVWAVFRENYSMIREVCDGLGIKSVEVHGDVSAVDKDEAVASFNYDPEVRVLIGHPGSGGIGINLVASDLSIFYSRDFSLEHDLQAEARNHRGGSEQHQKITRIDLVTPHTLDEKILEALSRKETISEQVLASIAIQMKKEEELRDE